MQSKIVQSVPRLDITHIIEVGNEQEIYRVKVRETKGYLSFQGIEGANLGDGTMGRLLLACGYPDNQSGWISFLQDLFAFIQANKKTVKVEFKEE